MNMPAKIAQPNIVNGINLDDVQNVVAGIERDPKNAMTSWRVATTWMGQTRSRAKVSGYKLAGEAIERHFSIDIDEPNELGGSNMFANPQEHLLAALNACMTVGYVALSSLQGITLEKLEIETETNIDLRGFFAMDPKVAPGCEAITYKVHIKGNGTKEQFAKIHEMVMATSPNFYNLSKPIKLVPELVVE